MQDHSANFYISSFEFQSISNVSSVARPSRYSDYTSTHLTSVALGNSYSFNLTDVGSTWEKSGLSIWIDFNKDGDFNDFNENVFYESASAERNRSGLISIPSNVSTGITRMRVAVKSWGDPTPCWDWGVGEVEDYAINIQSSSAFSRSPQVKTNSIISIPLNNVKIYVNNNTLHIKDLDIKITEVGLFNLLGQQIFYKKLKSINDTSIKLPHSISESIYLVKINTEKGIINKRIIISNQY